MPRKTYLIFGLLLGVWLMMTVPVVAQTPNDVADVAIVHAEATDLGTGEVEVTLVVAVSDETGQLVTGLSGLDFEVVEDDNNVTAHLQPLTVPASVMLLLDQSVLMGGTNSDGIRYFDVAKEGSKYLIDQLIAITTNGGSEFFVGVSSYDSNTLSSQSLSNSLNDAFNFIDGAPFDVSDSDLSCVYDALANTATNLLQSDETARRAIVVFTASPDSGEGCANTTPSDIEEIIDAAGNKLPIYVVGLNDTADLGGLAGLTSRTGGAIYSVDSMTQLNGQMNAVAQQLGQTYQLRYLSSKAEGGAVRVAVNVANESGLVPVFLPQATLPTPTPIPEFNIDLNIVTKGEQLHLEIDIPADVMPVRSELFVNDKPFRKKTKDFELFMVSIDELGSGAQTFRIEIEDDQSRIALAEGTLTIEPTATPPPTSTPLPVVQPTPEPTPEDTVIGYLPIIMIVAGAILFLALLGVIVYLIISNQRKAAVVAPQVVAPIPAPPVQPMVTEYENSEPSDDEERTIYVANDILTDLKAVLSVIEGEEFVPQKTFGINDYKVTIGRNAGRKANNDLTVEQRAVSREHAKIEFKNRRFYIEDLGLKAGTYINETKLDAGQHRELHSGDIIKIGSKVAFKFEHQPIPDLTEDDDDDDQTMVGRSIVEARTEDDGANDDQIQRPDVSN